MLDIDIFVKIFVPVFAVVISVGPCWLTYANVAMNYGLKKGFIGAAGCFTIEVVYMLIGITAIKQVGNLIPEILIVCLKIFAGMFFVLFSILFLGYRCAENGGRKT